MNASLRRPLSAGVVVLAMLHGETRLFAQEATGKLTIVIVEGEGAINNIRQRIAREPIIQVEDENHKPVGGAAVTFLVPRQGPGATFPGNSTSLRVTTDAQGRARATGLRANKRPGQYEIAVQAVAAGLTARAVIHQSNAKKPGTGWLKYAVIGAAAAAVIVAVVVVTRGDSPTVLIPGAPSVGGR